MPNAYVLEHDWYSDRLQEEYEKACAEIVLLRSLLGTQSAVGKASTKRSETSEFGVSKDEFCRAVGRAQHYIEEGDIFQVVLSQRIRQRSTADPFVVYRNLRNINPSPYMYFLRMGDLSVIGSSPEMLVRVVDRVVETRPIAGTRRRGKSKQEDLKPTGNGG